MNQNQKRKSLSKWAIFSRKEFHLTYQILKLIPSYFISGDKHELSGRMAATVALVLTEGAALLSFESIFFIQFHNSSLLEVTPSYR